MVWIGQVPGERNRSFRMTANLEILLRGFADFDRGELGEAVSYFKPRSVRRNTVLLQEGNICKEFYYIETGCIRTFFVDRNGYEKTRYIIADRQIGTTLTSFIFQRPSVESIEALDDTELLVMSSRDFYRLNNANDHWKTFYQKILELAYSFQNRKIEALMTLTAKQRYQQFLAENPSLVLRLTNKVLASYLDMREETLSRLKSE